MSEVKASKTTQAKAATKPETVVYIGPSILGVANHNTVYNNGLPQELQDAIEKEPAFKNLLVPISQLAAAGNDIANKRGAAYTFYEKAMQYKQEIRKQ